MEYLVPLLKASQYRDGILNARFLHHDGLESSFKRCVLFDVLAVFVQRRCADAVQLAPCQHGLKDIACVHGAFGPAGADDGMYLIDEENYPAFALFDLVEHRLQPLLELAAVFSARYQCAHVEREQLPSLKVIGYVAAYDSCRQALRNGGFADARFTDKTGVVLGLSGQDSDNIPYLVVPADHGIQLLLSCKLGQILAVFIEYVVGILGVIAVHPGIAPNILECGQVSISAYSVLLEQGSDAAVRLFDKSQH